MMGGKIMGEFFTTNKFWDCECNDDYIHPRSKDKCERCGIHQKDPEAPDSRVNEVLREFGSVDLGEIEFHADPDGDLLHEALNIVVSAYGNKGMTIRDIILAMYKNLDTDDFKTAFEGFEQDLQQGDI